MDMEGLDTYYTQVYGTEGPEAVDELYRIKDEYVRRLG